MKKITILLVIIFSFLFSTTSWGEWNYVTVSESGTKFYYDKDRIRNNGKYIYFWKLDDYKIPFKGSLSMTKYVELDCSIFRYKRLYLIVYKNSMGEGEIISEFDPKDNWGYPKPKSIREIVYNKICEEYQ